MGFLINTKTPGFKKACPEWRDDMIVDDFSDMNRADPMRLFRDRRGGKAKAREKLGKYVIGRTHAMQGDPGHLKGKKWDLIETVRRDGCPTDWSTGAYNDINLPDLHNHRILPYTSDDNVSAENVEKRQRMAWNNPATCALWFMIRRLTPPLHSTLRTVVVAIYIYYMQWWPTMRTTLQRYGLPASYKKWWMRKFEFTMRHAVHVHEISKRVFLFPRHERIEHLLKTKTSLSKLTPEDWIEVDFRGDRLASYLRITHVY